MVVETTWAGLGNGEAETRTRSLGDVSTRDGNAGITHKRTRRILRAMGQPGGLIFGRVWMRFGTCLAVWRKCRGILVHGTYAP